MSEVRAPSPPFTPEAALAKVRAVEDGWNARDPERVALAYTPNSRWRDRDEFILGRSAIVAFLTRKWEREIDCRLVKELWAFGGSRIAVRSAYEFHDDAGSWFRAYGNESWEFEENGLMSRRFSCVNDAPIREQDRLFRWPIGPRPDDHPGLSAFGL